MKKKKKVMKVKVLNVCVPTLLKIRSNTVYGLPWEDHIRSCMCMIVSMCASIHITWCVSG